jgi:glutamate-1-semialdehyde aminotransferase
MTIAIRIARAISGRDKVLFCGYHGWHDWYLSANLAGDRSLDGHLLPGLSPNGVPRSLKGTALPFAYNDTDYFLKLIKENQGKIGGIVLEAIRNDEPEKEFIAAIRQAATEDKIPLVLDEITSGWRLNLGGAHLLYGLEPDIAVFGKALSNGFPMAAIIGRRRVMQAAQESFISSTYWTDRIGPAAALATIKKLKDHNVPEHLCRIGKLVKQAWQSAADKQKIPIEIHGIDPLAHFGFKHEKALCLKTLFTQEMLARGILASTVFYASYAHQEQHVEAYAQAADQAFALIARAIKSGKPEKYLKGPVCHAGFKRLT